MEKNNTGKPALHAGRYFKYAIGEILLVVVGILLALQINNWNENNKKRTKELIYLENIKSDLQLNINSLNEFIEARESSIKSVEILMEYFNETKLLDPENFNFHSFGVMIWFPFVQHSNTYQELMNSGNLASISNKNIKSGLQNMQTSYEKIHFIENEMQQDFETYLYEPYFSTSDADVDFRNYDCQLAQIKGVSCSNINRSDVQKLLKNKLFKNGFALSSINSNLLLIEYTNMVKNTSNLIVLIENELAE